MRAASYIFFRVTRMAKSLVTLIVLVLLAGVAYAQSGAGNDPATLTRLWKQENEKCRGRHGDDPRIDAACAARETYDSKLRAIGWCFEYRGAATTDWHHCTPATRR